MFEYFAEWESVSIFIDRRGHRRRAQSIGHYLQDVCLVM